MEVDGWDEHALFEIIKYLRFEMREMYDYRVLEEDVPCDEGSKYYFQNLEIIREKLISIGCLRSVAEKMEDEEELRILFQDNIAGHQKSPLIKVEDLDESDLFETIRQLRSEIRVRHKCRMDNVEPDAMPYLERSTFFRSIARLEQDLINIGCSASTRDKYRRELETKGLCMHEGQDMGSSIYKQHREDREKQAEKEALGMEIYYRNLSNKLGQEAHYHEITLRERFSCQDQSSNVTKLIVEYCRTLKLK